MRPLVLVQFNPVHRYDPLVLRYHCCASGSFRRAGRPLRQSGPVFGN